MFALIHHQKKRHRKKNKPHPITEHPTFKKYIDRVVYVVAFIGPLMTIPQITKVWTEPGAEGVSVISWSTYFGLNFFWLTYSILHKEKPLILTSVLWIVANGLVALGAIVNG
ncbi:MAG: hypothetical protein Q8P90_00665 [bacterium]|nr:hypothetical protein [bacterium]